MKITILGDGAWGTTLAILLSKKGYKVTLWSPFPSYLDFLDKKRENIKYLPGIKIPKEIIFEKEIKKALLNSKIIIIAIPSKFFRRVVKRLKPFRKKEKIFVSVAKGIEEKTLKRMSEILKEELGKISFGVLSGPTIASEVAKKMPSVAVVASPNQDIAQKLQEIFFISYLRLYRCQDVIGVELGGALKNIIAIAAGISDGLGFGANTKAAILARGIVEIQRLGTKMGARKKTLFGIAGLGDLAVTCISPRSRNRTFGERIGRGEKIKDILKDMMDIKPGEKKDEVSPVREKFSNGVRGIPEGVTTVKAGYRLAKLCQVEMPILEAVYEVLWKEKSPKKMLQKLMERPKKKE